MLLLVSGSFDSITSMYVFVNWALYLLMSAGLFIYRRRNPNAPRPFSVPGYPWVPAVFTVFTLFYLGATLIGDVQAYRAGEVPLIKSLAGVALVLTGIPFYLILRRHQKS
jgi:APA family basic amino acid/polyamine antiporter